MRSLKFLIGSPAAACVLFLCMMAIAAAQTPIQDDQKSISKWAEDTVYLGMIKQACGGYYFVETGAADRTFEWYVNWGVDHFGSDVFKKVFDSQFAGAVGAIKAAGSGEAWCLTRQGECLEVVPPHLVSEATIEGSPSASLAIQNSPPSKNSN
jgi:hypothetical protein